MMHLGFLTSEYPHPRTTRAAGIGSSIKNMVAALVEKGVKVSIFIYGQKENDTFTEGQIKFHLIQHRTFRLFGWYLHRKFLQDYLNKYIAVDKIDAIEAPDWTGITAFMGLNCPLVIRFHGSDTYFCKLESRPQKKKNFWFEKLALKRADHLLSVSKFTAEETRKIFNITRKIEVIPNSVDVDVFKPQKTAIEKGTILYFGSIIRKKGVLELPDIFNKIIEKKNDSLLLIAGKDVADYRRSISTRKLMEQKFSPVALKRVKWLGELSYEDVLEHIAKSNVVVLPSFAEALPMTWLEAMAMEKALVTSDIGWAHELIIDGETGFTVAPKDHEDYAEKTLLLLSDSELAEKMGKAARQKIVSKFSNIVVVENYLNFYTGIVNPGNKSQQV